MNAAAPDAALRRRARRDACWLLALVWVVYALTSPGDLLGDTDTRWAIAENLAHHGQLHLAEPGAEVAEGHKLPGGLLAVPGREGRWYSWYGLGQPLCLVPFVLAGDALAALGLPGVGGPGGARLAGQFLASVGLFPLFGALWALAVHRFAFDLTGRAGAARVAALVSAFATLAWPHTVTTYESSQEGLLITLAAWLAWRGARRDADRTTLPLMFAAMGAALLFRTSAAVALIPIGLVALTADLARTPGSPARLARLGRWIAAGCVGLLPFVAVIAIYNHARFGSPLETGYAAATAAQGFGDRLFGNPLHLGVAGMLFSPGKSIFLYAPVFLLSVVGLLRLRRGLVLPALLTAAAFASCVLVYARLPYWAGDVAWGPRYLAPLSGLLALGVLPWLTPPEPRRVARFTRLAVSAVLALSVAVQLAGLAYNQNLEFAQQPRHGLNPDSYTWRPDESHLAWRLRNLASHATGQPLLNPAAEPNLPLLHAPQLFPFKYAAVSGTGTVYRILLTLWVTGLAAAAGIALLWRRSLRVKTD